MSAQLTFEGPRVGATRSAVRVRHGRLRRTWLRIGRTVREMNYASRRLVEVQAPWVVDRRWHQR